EGTEQTYVATGLAENQTYVFYVVASNEIGASETEEVSVSTAAVPHAPTGLVAGEYADGSVVLTWNDVDAETGYRVYAQDGGNWIQVGSDLAADTTQVEITNLSDYAKYTFSVAAFNDEGESVKSTAVVVDTTVAPAVPTGLKFTFGASETYQGDGKATFVWNAVEHASGYQIEQKIDGVWTTITSTPATSYDLTGLANYSTYEYRVAAYATRGTDRLLSPYASATLSTAWVPTGELALVAGAYDSATKSVELTWNAVEAATNYKVEQNVGGVWTSVGTTSATTYTLDLADNTNYVFRVVVTNEIGDGSSDTVEFFTAAAPAAPTVGGSYDSLTQSATITFSSAYATTYTVVDENGTELYTGSNTSFVHEGLEENATYQYIVVASNDLGDSPATAYSLYTAAVPAAPTGLAFGEYADGAVDFSWNAVDAATGYCVYVQNGSTWEKVGEDLATNSVRLTGLSDYNVYAFCVTAFNGEGESLQSAPATLDTTVTPDAPIVSVTYGGGSTYKGDGKATLVWDAVDHAEGYYVARKDGGKWTFLAKTNDLAFNVSDMENFSTYEYGVASYATRYGEELASDYASVTIDTTWIPEGTLTLTVGAYDYVADKAPVFWTSVERATGYRIDVTDSVGETTSVETPNTAYTLALADNESYVIRVTAF
ncbi:MAG: fibronectin type III domain-containing protein, partial [Thermoguttaceae bacterium]|nr:fibronectin type III domain-containing protein [Thermoguttaceae bacterium]